MKPASLLVCAFSLSLVACGSSQKPADAPTGSSKSALSSSSSSSSEESAEPKTKTAAEEWAEKKVQADTNAKTAPRESGDPLAMNSDVEAASIPKIDMTPAKELRAKSKGDLYAAVALMRSATSVEDAAKKITGRLGKPTWTENGQKHIWVVTAGPKCHRLVLTPDGEANVEDASKTEWRGLSALAQQNPCTGEIKRGIASGK
jgi:hypothetical protein